MKSAFLFWQVTKEVEKRIEDLTHQVHREILARCVEQVKTLAPILICSMKIFIQIILQGNTHTSTDMTWNRRLEKQILCVLQIYDDDMITSAMTANPPVIFHTKCTKTHVASFSKPLLTKLRTKKNLLFTNFSFLDFFAYNPLKGTKHLNKHLCIPKVTWQDLCFLQENKFFFLHDVWKSQKKSHSTLRAKRATFTF